MAKYKLPKIEELLDAGVHFGHQVKRWHPKMEKYIFGVRKNIHIIDLEQTEAKLKEACDFLYELAKNGEQVVLVGTKRQARDVIELEAKRSGALYVTERWIGGTLTNFKIIKKNIDKFLSLSKRKAEGDLERYTKKERLLIDIDLEKLQRNIGGIVNMRGTPSAVFIVDARRERTAIREAKRAGVKVVALVDTNSDPAGIDYVIPGNDDAIKSVAAILKSVADALEEGYKEFAKQSAKKDKEAEVKKIRSEEAPKAEKAEVSAETATVSTDESPVVTDDPSIEATAGEAEAIQEEK